MATTVFVNEIHYDNTGTDTGEAIEIAGPAGTDLSGWSLALYNGTGGAVYNMRALSGTIPDAGAGLGVLSFDYPSNGIQNGAPDGVALVDPAGTVVQFLTYEGFFTAVGGPADGLPGTDIGVDEAGTEPVGFSLQLTGSGTVAEDFTWTGPLEASFGSLNLGQGGDDLPPPPPPPLATISEIQGAGHRSPLEGETVRTSGIVTARDSNGFWLQDPTGDGDDATADGIFVFTGNTLPDEAVIGTELALTGRVTEFLPGNNANNLTVTELTGPTGLAVLSTGNALPAAVVLGEEGRLPPTQVIEDDGFASFDPATDGIDFFESLEGMRLAVPEAVAISGTNSFGETWVLADGGAGAGPRNARGGITLVQGDDNPERIQVDTDSGVLPGFNPAVTTGDALHGLEGVLSYDFGNYELVPTSAFEVTLGGLQPESTALEADRRHLLVAEYNVENLDPGDGARIGTLAEQIVLKLNTPDILALQEIQDGNGTLNDGLTDASVTYQALADAIVSAGGPRYAFADIPPADDTSGGEPGGNIRTGFLYDPTRVTLLPDSLRQVLDSDLSDGDAFADSRTPLVGDFQFGREVVTIINIHSSSKGGGTSLFGAVQPAVNGSEEQRIAQAEEINAFVDGLLAEDNRANILVVGDANEFAWNPSQHVMTGEAEGRRGQVLFDLAAEQEPPEERYTYNFDGNAQALDHSLVSRALLNRAEYDTVHLNSEYPDAERVSDHDPSVIQLFLPPGTDWHGMGG
ncbi:hypothetical protein GCM10011504_49440 [Siccirubricoccus deserti]|uniref:Nuclease n=1 Tax=Siccirubricoccus deserti TaxID=2013562 RepID=A0A9X0UEY7_9PROT|nr:endonuclease/exonuclease/phosphatase family protein [Siccirubricoccus deserti]MBC4018399.1 nuclease [Siccirubricoccus deserti]GGC65561.1 hypothetical protein GCM10011504_49440 [Siccirubricoccus deserti]